jgi:hypothetical protein
VSQSCTAAAIKCDWHFDYIKVTRTRGVPGSATSETLFFNGPCRLTARAPCVELLPSRESVFRVYKLRFWTANAAHSGTDATVAVLLTGTTNHGSQESPLLTEVRFSPPRPVQGMLGPWLYLGCSVSLRQVHGGACSVWGFTFDVLASFSYQ